MPSDRELQDIFEEAKAAPQDLSAVRLRHARRDLIRLPLSALKLSIVVAAAICLIFVLPDALGRPDGKLSLGSLALSTAEFGGLLAACAFGLALARYLYRLVIHVRSRK